jgi:uncharacterized membrane protein HdeD (DUF308 family)
MSHPERARFQFAWISLVLVGVAIVVFGLVVAIWPGPDETRFLRAIGAASIGMGLFGALITLFPFRRRERWAWIGLWYYPLFWLVHLVGNLPPGEDHIHQVVFIALSLVGLLLSASEFYPRQQ